MMLIARIATSDESNECVLELAARIVELQQIELGLDDRTANVGAAILRRRQRVRESAALLVRLVDLADAIDLLEHLRDRRARILAVGRAHGHRDLANLALDRAQLLFAAGAEQRAFA